MTYIQPKQNNHNYARLWLGLIIFLIAAAANIFLYSQVVNLQHQILSQEQLLEETRLANANLKNQLYQLLDVSNLTELIEERGLIKINNPDYLGV